MDIRDIANLTQQSVESVEAARALIHALAQATGLTPNRAASVLSGASGDARSKLWKYRILIFNESDTLVADSEPDLHPTSMGETTAQSLPHLANICAQTVCAYHKGLNSAQVAPLFTSRIQTLRNSLARDGFGRASWRVRYAVDGAPHLARVEVQSSDALTDLKRDGVRKSLRYLPTKG